MNNIHPTAIIDASAQLGDEIIVGPYVVIEDNVIIGDRTRIDAHANIKRYTKMGSDNHIHSYALVGGEPQDLKFQGEVTWLEIGNGNRIREFATLHRGTAGGGALTKLGNNNLCMAYIHIAHDCILGSNIVMSNGATLGGHVQVQDNAVLGGLCAVHQFGRIGRNAFVGGMTGVAQDLPPWMLAAGSRAMVQGPNLVGLRRSGMPKESISAIKDAYRLIWRSNMLRTAALDELEQKYGELPELADFITFVRQAERGICPAERSNGEE